MWRALGRKGGGSGRLVAVPTLAVLVFLLGGCTTGHEPTLDPTGSRPTGSIENSGDVPAFGGPWAADFAAAYGRATSDFERQVLADGVISDQELAEAQEKFSSCLASFGFEVTGFDDDGAFSFDAPEGADPDRTNEQVKQCSTESGESSIGALHSWMRRNPQNQDEATIMAACLVDKGVVDRGYAADDYERDAPTQGFPFIDAGPGEQAFRECNADPLGLLDRAAP